MLQTSLCKGLIFLSPYFLLFHFPQKLNPLHNLRFLLYMSQIFLPLTLEKIQIIQYMHPFQSILYCMFFQEIQAIAKRSTPHQSPRLLHIIPKLLLLSHLNLHAHFKEFIQVTQGSRRQAYQFSSINSHML